MLRISTILASVTAVLFLAGTALAYPSRTQVQPGLGIFTGVTIDSSDDINMAHNFGFFVDLPLVKRFHIVPSADTYVLNIDPGGGAKKIGKVVTDFNLGFKFVLPLNRLEVYAMVAPGLTNTEGIEDNEVKVKRWGQVGFGGGLYFRLIDMLYAMAQVEYKQTFNDDVNPGTIHTNVGVLFRF